MQIPQTVVDALAAIPATNPLPAASELAVTQVSLTEAQAELDAWREVQAICQGQLNQATQNVAILSDRVTGLKLLLKVP